MKGSEVVKAYSRLWVFWSEEAGWVQMSECYPLIGSYDREDALDFCDIDSGGPEAEGGIIRVTDEFVELGNTIDQINSGDCKRMLYKLK